MCGPWPVKGWDGLEKFSPT